MKKIKEKHYWFNYSTIGCISGLDILWITVYERIENRIKLFGIKLYKKD